MKKGDKIHMDYGNKKNMLCEISYSEKNFTSIKIVKPVQERINGYSECLKEISIPKNINNIIELYNIRLYEEIPDDDSQFEEGFEE